MTDAVSGNAPDPMIDVSIIINIHREISYLGRTFQSLAEAAIYAAGQGIRCEMIVVRDRSDPSTRGWTDRYDYSPYERHEIIDVENGSLGLSRNCGIARATGVYVLTADADDLVSYNYIVAMWMTAQAMRGKIIFFPEWYLGFGCNPHLYEMRSLREVTPFALFDYHPYVSRCFIAREHLAGLAYADLRLTAGFAYEDWHFNIEAVGRGFDLRVVPDTIVYYRQRLGSLLRLADGLSNGLTGQASFFDPPTFLRVTGKIPDEFRRRPAPSLTAPDMIRERFLSNATCWEMTLDAAEIDPGIDPAGIGSIHAFSNVGGSREMGMVYHALCRLVGNEIFDEVLLVPFLSRGGGEKYVMSVILDLFEQAPERRLLILSGEPFERHAWLDRLPPGALFIDLYALSQQLDDGQRQILSLRIIEAAAREARIHIKSCPYAIGFLKRFGRQIAHHSIIYYRFCDSYEAVRGGWVARGWEFDFLSEYGYLFERIVTDNDTIRHSDTRRLDALAGRYATLYNLVSVHPRRRKDGTPPTGRILWASRLDAQKRPELLTAIADGLARVRPNLKIDVYGSSVLDRFDTAVFTGHSNIAYCGDFEGFETLEVQDYDLFLYTSAFDGLPNVVLEAMAANLVVVAPDLGGMREALGDGRGVLLDPDLPDEGLVTAYVDAMIALYKNREWMDAIRRAARDYVAVVHGQCAFRENINAIMGRISTLAEGPSLPPRRELVRADSAEADRRTE